MFKPIHQDNWNKIEAPRPQVVVAGFAVRPDGKFPVLYRTDKVRSAKNCWSLPSGMHEIGLTYDQQFSNELEEELGLVTLKVEGKAVSTYHEPLVGYENILEGWHWCINMMVILVEDAEIINKEPDKHSEIRWVHFEEMLEIKHKCHPTLKHWIDFYLQSAIKATGDLRQRLETDKLFIKQ